MATLHKYKTKEEKIHDEPPSLHGRAMDNLEFIRETMQRSTEFTAVPGYGGMLMGVTAIGAAVIASFQTTGFMWTVTWIVEAFLAVSVGSLMMWQKSKYGETPLNSEPAKKFALGFMPAIISAVVLTILLASKGLFQYLPTVWLTLYGTAVVTGGAFSVGVLRLKGWAFIFLGAISVVVPTAYGNWMMALGFGVFNVVFGFVIARKYGG